jgi:hypothetical protein
LLFSLIYIIFYIGCFLLQATTLYPGGIRSPVSSVAGGDDTSRPRHQGFQLLPSYLHTSSVVSIPTISSA